MDRPRRGHRTGAHDARGRGAGQSGTAQRSGPSARLARGARRRDRRRRRDDDAGRPARGAAGGRRMTGVQVADHVWWLAARASGLVTLALVTASVIAGLMLGGKLARRPGLARALRAGHEHAAAAGLVAIGIHGATLLGDAWLRPGLAGVLVPGAMGYRPVAVGAGIVAAYLAAALGLSFPLRKRIGQ